MGEEGECGVQDWLVDIPSLADLTINRVHPNTQKDT
jgi:hypothetical protein